MPYREYKFKFFPCKNRPKKTIINRDRGLLLKRAVVVTLTGGKKKIFFSEILIKAMSCSLTFLLINHSVFVIIPNYYKRLIFFFNFVLVRLNLFLTSNLKFICLFLSPLPMI